MSTAPGWYDAGTPGRVRWWDGSQWTSHEADAPAQAAQTGPVPGWYETSPESARWWDGKKWTGLRTKNGVPMADWANAEQVSAAWVLAAVFLALATAQLALGTMAPGVTFAGVPMLLVAALWLGIAVQTTMVLRLPVPTSAPLTLDVFRPLPGEQEAAGAGWYAVSPTVTRWWTGARWSRYTNTRFGIRPTFHGPQTKKALRGITIGIFALAVVVLIVGIVFIVIGANDPSNYVAPVIGWVLTIGSLLFAVLGVVVIAMMRHQLRLLDPPAEPPRLWG